MLPINDYAVLRDHSLDMTWRMVYSLPYIPLS